MRVLDENVDSQTNTYLLNNKKVHDNCLWSIVSVFYFIRSVQKGP